MVKKEMLVLAQFRSWSSWTSNYGKDRDFFRHRSSYTTGPDLFSDRPRIRDERKSYCTHLSVENSLGPKVVMMIPGTRLILAYPSAAYDYRPFAHQCRGSKRTSLKHAPHRARWHSQPTQHRCQPQNNRDRLRSNLQGHRRSAQSLEKQKQPRSDGIMAVLTFVEPICLNLAII